MARVLRAGVSQGLHAVRFD
ncbi:MAG: hypothetical protein ACREMM_01905 [Gemmatimonadales bacterium]